MLDYVSIAIANLAKILALIALFCKLITHIHHRDENILINEAREAMVLILDGNS